MHNARRDPKSTTTLSKFSGDSTPGFSGNFRLLLRRGQQQMD
jgi:hypothetical protein